LGSNGISGDSGLLRAGFVSPYHWLEALIRKKQLHKESGGADLILRHRFLCVVRNQPLRRDGGVALLVSLGMMASDD
jgi:hypothetical protein